VDLFRKLGRQVEQLKTKAEMATGDDTAYQCTACEARFDEQHRYCPECGSGDVVPVEREA